MVGSCSVAARSVFLSSEESVSWALKLGTPFDVDTALSPIRPIDHFFSSLWPNNPEHQKRRAAFYKWLCKTPEFNFWARWYHAMENGPPLDRHILREVALIPEYEWQLGLENIASEIADIELRYMADRFVRSEKIILRNSKFVLVPDKVDDEDRYENAVQKVRDTLSDILLFHNKDPEKYSSLHEVAHILSRTFEVYGNQPLRVHDDFTKASRIITGRVERNLLDGNDIFVHNFVNDLLVGAVDIRASDKNVNRAVKSRARSKILPMNIRQQASLEAEVADKSQRSSDELARDLLQDFEILNKNVDSSGSSTEQDTDFAAYRLAGRLPEMNDLDREEDTKTGRMDKVIGAAENADKLGKGANAVKQGWEWINYLLSLF